VAVDVDTLPRPVTLPPPASQVPPAATPVALASARDLDWGQLVDDLPLAGLARELARNSALAGFDGHLARLVVAPQYERLAARRHVDTLQAALSEHFGQAVRIDVTVAVDERLATPSQQQLAAAAARQREAEEAVAQDPKVAALRAAFDATIEDVSAR